MRRQTILITGASRGIGEATARLFHARGWNVAATMRFPGSSTLVPDDRLKLYSLDVTDRASVQSAVDDVVADFGRLDVVVNNAGVCILAPFEELSEDDDRLLMETNILGAMRVVRAVLPHMRNQGGGRIIAMSSICGAMTLPLYSGYCATKWALEGFSESLSFELRQHNIKIKIIEPAAYQTGSFAQQLADRQRRAAHPSYRDFMTAVLPNLVSWERAAPEPAPVAESIWSAANDRWPRLRYRPRSRMMLAARALVPGALYVRAVRRLLNAW